MNLLDIKNFTKTPVEKMKKLKAGDAIELLTYKKDRKVVIIKEDEHNFRVVEDGFEIKEFPNVAESKLVKLLKRLQAIEFPRSNKFFMRSP